MTRESVEEPLKRAAAWYFMHARNARGLPADPVARFHLGNGARLERLHWAANLNPKGIAESLGMMVNYVYEPRTIEDNHEQFVTAGRVARSAEVEELLKRSARSGNGKTTGRDPQAAN